MKIANIDREVLHIFWTTSGITMLLLVTENQGFTLSLEDTFFKKPHGGGWGQTPPLFSPPQPFQSYKASCCCTILNITFKCYIKAFLKQDIIIIISERICRNFKNLKEHRILFSSELQVADCKPIKTSIL